MKILVTSLLISVGMITSAMADQYRCTTIESYNHCPTYGYCEPRIYRQCEKVYRSYGDHRDREYRRQRHDADIIGSAIIGIAIGAIIAGAAR